MVHKCLRCWVKMKNPGTLYMNKHQIINHVRKETGIPFHVEVCPNCGKAELFKVSQ